MCGSDSHNMTEFTRAKPYPPERVCLTKAVADKILFVPFERTLSRHSLSSRLVDLGGLVFGGHNSAVIDPTSCCHLLAAVLL